LNNTEGFKYPKPLDFQKEVLFGKRFEMKRHYVILSIYINVFSVNI